MALDLPLELFGLDFLVPLGGVLVSRSDDGETSSTVKIMAAAKNDEEI
jgi:hypothetical protein